MTCTQIEVAGMRGIVCTGGPGHCIVVDGSTFYFEVHRFCGILVCSKDGDERKAPGPRHRLWDAVDLWQAQGSQVCDGRCVFDWDKEVVPISRHIGGRNKDELEISMEFKTKKERLLAIVAAYQTYVNRPVTIEEVATWATEHGLWPVPKRGDPVEECDAWESRFEEARKRRHGMA